MRCLPIVLALLFGGCASLPTSDSSSPADISGMVSVATDGGPLGQVCPISPRYALTAGHLSGGWTSPVFTGSMKRMGWSLLADIDGEPTHIHEYAYDNYRDLAIVEIKKGKLFTNHYRLAEVLPVKGDKLYIRGFNVQDGFSADLLEIEVIRIDMGYIFFKPSGEGGSSGSCILNDRNEVVGINVHGYRESVLKPEIGGGCLVVGEFGAPRFPPGVFDE